MTVILMYLKYLKMILILIILVMSNMICIFILCQKFILKIFLILRYKNILTFTIIRILKIFLSLEK